MKITQPDIKKFPTGEYRDDDVPGLRLRVRESGHRSFALRYTLPTTGERKRLNLGDATLVTLAAARAEARKRLGGMFAGIDPAKGLQRTDGPTVDELLNRYVGAADLSPATAKEWRRIIDVEIVPILGSRRAKDLKRSEVRELGASICKRSGYTANRAFVILRSAFSWALSQDILEATPFFGLKQPFASERRSDRVLSPDELRALIFVLDELRKPKRKVSYRAKNGVMKTRVEVGGDHYADALLILLLTGVRRRSATEARLNELFLIDDENADTLAEWRVDPARLKMRQTKRATAKAHIVPLSRQAVAVFRHRVRAVAGSEILFPRSRKPRHIGRQTSWWSSRWIRKLKVRMSELLGAPIADWKVHNLRHTVATHIEEELHVAESTTAGILGHSQGRGVTSRYALAQHLTARRIALQAWADWLDSLRRTSFQVQAGGRA